MSNRCEAAILASRVGLPELPGCGIAYLRRATSAHATIPQGQITVHRVVRVIRSPEACAGKADRPVGPAMMLQIARQVV